MFDNTNFPWQKDLSPDIPTLGDMMRKAGYYTAYKGKWHLSADFEQDANGPYRLLREEMEQYGFSDYDSLGDMIGHTLGGYQNDHLVAGNAIRWLRTKGVELRGKNQPWFMVTSLVNPHDIMYFNADLAGENQQYPDQKYWKCFSGRIRFISHIPFIIHIRWPATIERANHSS